MIEERTLPQIVDMGNEKIRELLKHQNFGHLGCCRDNRPYVIPIHFAYSDPDIYFYTTEGLKTEIIGENATVCLQVEEIDDRKHWKSVIVTGTAERMTSQQDIDHAKELVEAANPRLLPAWSIRWMDQWVKSNIEAVYRISPEILSGRMTIAQRDDTDE
ncbi:MAG: pyridoxamine 5'-phosphate oxidase family protein [Pyrinomonadaceae bacterium]